MGMFYFQKDFFRAVGRDITSLNQTSLTQAADKIRGGDTALTAQVIPTFPNTRGLLRTFKEIKCRRTWLGCEVPFCSFSYDSG